MNKLKQNKAITLIALIITIIVLLILAGVVINMTVGNNGIIQKSQFAVDKYKLEQAREKLELALVEMQTDKSLNSNYNSDDYLTAKLQEKGFTVEGDEVTVDGFVFIIDRSVPKIIGVKNENNGETGEGGSTGETGSTGENEPEEVDTNKNIQVRLAKNIDADYAKGTLTIEVEYEGTISSIQIGDEAVENIASYKDGNVYTIVKPITENGTYTVKAIDENDLFAKKSIQINEITEDMLIMNLNDLKKFRNNVNSGRTYEGRTVTLGADLDLSTICHPATNNSTKVNWIPIGLYIVDEDENDVSTYFKGTFDGEYNNVKHKISNLYTEGGGSDPNGGFFGAVYGAVIQNLEINNSTVSGGDGVAAVCGWATHGSTIQNCKSINNVISSTYSAGGIIGACDSNTVIILCESINNTISGESNIGGISGNLVNSRITDCSNTSNITTGGIIVGGIVGNAVTNSVVEGCFNTGDIHGDYMVRWYSPEVYMIKQLVSIVTIVAMLKENHIE